MPPSTMVCPSRTLTLAWAVEVSMTGASNVVPDWVSKNTGTALLGEIWSLVAITSITIVPSGDTRGVTVNWIPTARSSRFG